MTEFDKKGEFSDTHRALLNQIRQRHDRLGKKVIEAEQMGMTWELMKTEYDRDLSSLFDELLLWEEGVDAEIMKNRKP